MDIYFRALAPENWSKSGSNLVASQLETSASSVKAYCFLNPSTLHALGGTKSNALSPSTIFSSSLMSTTLHVTLPSSDFSYDNWMSKGWDLDSLEIFKSQLKTWLTANFVPFSVLNPNNSVNAYILDKTISGTRYVVPMLYIGNTGTLVQTITGNVSINYTTPVYVGSDFTITGSVTDNSNPVQSVSVTLTLDNQTKTVTSGADGSISASFSPIANAGVYTLNWSANINGTSVTKSRPFTITTIQTQSVSVVTSPVIPTRNILFSAIATLRNASNNTLNNAKVTLTYNGNSVTGYTDSSGVFSTNYLANSGATSLSYDAVSVSGASTLTFATLQSTTVSVSPTTPTDTQSFTASATVRNSLNNLVPNAPVSLTYNGVTQTGTSNAQGIFSATFTASYGKETLSYNVNSNELSGSTSFTVAKTTPTLASITMGSLTPNTLIVNDPFSVVVTAYDQYSVGLPSTAIQIKTGATVLGSGTTSANGTATISSIAPSLSGSYSVYANSGAINSTAQVLTVDKAPPQPASLTTTEPNPSSLFTGNNFFITVSVFDQYGQPFTESRSVTITDGTNTLGTGNTNSSGQSTVLCSAPTTAGVYSIYAKLNSITSATKTLTVS